MISFVFAPFPMQTLLIGKTTRRGIRSCVYHVSLVDFDRPDLLSIGNRFDIGRRPAGPSLLDHAGG